MQKKQDQLSTGKRVSAPSDDPVAISKILKYKTKINELEQYDKNSKDALSWTQTSELAIADISSSLDRARELAVQAANETNTQGERENIAKEIRQLKEHIIGNANKTFAGKYIFSSFQTDKKLLNDDGTFNINITEKELTEKPTTTYEVGVGETMQVSTNGLDLFGAILDESNFATNLPSGNDEGSRATQTRLVGEGFDPTLDYSSGDYNFDIQVNNDTFTVDLSSLNGTSNDITNKEFKDLILSSETGGTALEEVATVSFDSNNNLIIESKDYGAPDGTTSGYIEFTTGTNDVFTESDVIDGENIVEATVVDTDLTLTDAGIRADEGMKTIVIEYFGETKEIQMNMDDYNDDPPVGTVGDFITDLQDKIDLAFEDKIDELNTIDPTADYGIKVTENPAGSGIISFSTTDSFPNGPVPSLEVRPVKSEQPEMMKDLDNFIKALEDDDTEKIDEFIGNVDQHLENVNASRSEIGAKTNRLEMILSRIGDDSINVTQLLSNSQDVDMAETIMLLKNAENVYKASLSGGARVIQPSLLDFLR
jgi:flagellar hook-associated protein 3